MFARDAKESVTQWIPVPPQKNCRTRGNEKKSWKKVKATGGANSHLADSDNINVFFFDLEEDMICCHVTRG